MDNPFPNSTSAVKTEFVDQLPSKVPIPTLTHVWLTLVAPVYFLINARVVLAPCLLMVVKRLRAVVLRIKSNAKIVNVFRVPNSAMLTTLWLMPCSYSYLLTHTTTTPSISLTRAPSLSED
jgi:hypothetical protein